jgi:hypothetical protein
MVNFLGKNRRDLWPNFWPYECKGNNSQVVTEEGAEDKNHIGRLTKEEKGTSKNGRVRKSLCPFHFRIYKNCMNLLFYFSFRGRKKCRYMIHFC